MTLKSEIFTGTTLIIIWIEPISNAEFENENGFSKFENSNFQVIFEHFRTLRFMA